MKRVRRVGIRGVGRVCEGERSGVNVERIIWERSALGHGLDSLGLWVK